MMLGAVTINNVLIGIPQKSKKFTDFSSASFRLSSEVMDNFEKIGYMIVAIMIFGKKFNVS